MNKQIDFESNRSIEELKTETKDYFQNQGFKLIYSDPNSLKFKRGSAFQNSFTFNPLKWKSLITITFDNNKVSANFEIDTIYQVVSVKEEKMWETFISNYSKTIETGKSFISENKAELNTTKKSNWMYLGYAVLGAIIFAIPSVFIANFTGVDTIVSIGSAIGATIFLLCKINKDREDSQRK